MPARINLQQFVDDELARAPLVADEAIEGALSAMQRANAAMAPAERIVAGALSEALRQQRRRMSAAYSESLREHAQQRLASRAAPAAGGMPAFLPKGLELSLVDEDAVASDVEISHAAEAIKSTAEYELRELATYIAALVGDMDIARDHNPVGAEPHARALWAAAQALPLSSGFQVSFMRHAATPLAQVLRKAFASASTRLEDAGVQPALYRTLILPSGARTERPGRTLSDQVLRDISAELDRTSPVNYAANVVPAGRAAASAVAAAAAVAAAPGAAVATATLAEPTAAAHAPAQAQNAQAARNLDLLRKLFDFVLADKQLARSARTVISRLQAPALRIALTDRRLLGRNDHPLWRLIDAIAAQAELLPEAPHPERQRAQTHLDGLVDHIGLEPEPGEQLMRWALQRLQAAEELRLDRRAQQHAQAIVGLSRLDFELANGPLAEAAQGTTTADALDAAQLDTVPAELLEQAPPRTDAEGWVDQRRPGDALLMFLQGRWLHTQLLWRGNLREVWLFGDARSDEVWPLRRGALRRLRAEGLAELLVPRSLVREATEMIAARLPARG